MSFIYVTHESQPARPYLAPEHYLEHPILGRGLSRAVGTFEVNKAVFEIAPTDPPTLAEPDAADEASITDEGE